MKLFYRQRFEQEAILTYGVSYSFYSLQSMIPQNDEYKQYVGRVLLFQFYGLLDKNTPKDTSCITQENLDMYYLEQALSRAYTQ